MLDRPDAHLPVLLVDDEESLCGLMSLTLRNAGIRNVQSISDSRKVIPFLEEHGAALVLLDLFMPHLSGQELLGLIRHDHPEIQVVVVSGSNELKLAVECMKLGAIDYLSKPLESNRLIACVNNALMISTMKGELSFLKKQLLEDFPDNPEAFAEIKTRSNKMLALFKYVEVIARSTLPILITGETGVGKELMARAVYRLSGVGGEFVSVNAAGLDDATFSDTLFGHKKGAFTGADQTREGMVAIAAGGTLFLDEIGDMEERSQIKLLRLLQEGEYYPVGSDTLKKTTARIVAATNHDLSNRVAQQKFRRDLLYRLSIHNIHIPSLHERPEDISLLLDHFLDEAARTYARPKPAVAVSALSHLLGWSFPGNVRELKSMVFDALARHDGGELTARNFGGYVEEPKHPSVPGEVLANCPVDRCLDMMFGHFPTIHEAEIYLIDEALRRASGNLNLAAAMLGITRQTITNRKKANVNSARFGKSDIPPMGNLFERQDYEPF